jgi:hypothetical protein
MRDSSWSRKLTGRLRKTRQHQERVEKAQQQLAAERAAYEQRPASELLTPDQVRQSKPKQYKRSSRWPAPINYYYRPKRSDTK